MYKFIKDNIVYKPGKRVLLKEILVRANNMHTSNRQMYTEEDVIDICKECFPDMIPMHLSDYDGLTVRLVFMNYCINENDDV